ncbi:MAG: hypothetical protein KA765_07545 [Thermoflexales bacterium]|nr:hypothetical protein [Thermoflexales bacterium]
MKRLAVIAMTLVALTASCTRIPIAADTSAFSPEEQKVIAAVGARYESGFYFSRADCVQAVENGTIQQCVFPVGVELLTRPEWKQLLSNTIFYLVDIGSWRSANGLLPHEGQDGGIGRQIVAWQNGQAYHIENFDRLLEDSAITINDTNRELVARSFALMSIPDYLGGDVRFLEWKPVKPGTYRHNYTHALKAWTETWGCEVFWWFVFSDEHITIASRSGGSCQIDEYGNYIKDSTHFQFGDAAIVPLGVPPYFQDYRFNR